LIELLHPWVAFGIMPVFALANAGGSLELGSLGEARVVAVAVMLGLVVGKPIGILLATWLALRLGIARLPHGIGLPHLAVLGMVAGVGFTMALFVAQLAFADPRLLAAAKIGVLGASLAAGLLGLLAGRAWLARPAA
jgi:NhaA family Na+:H+ antiporter